MLPRDSRQDRGPETNHHPTKRGTQQDQPPDAPRCSQCCTIKPDASEGRKPTRNGRTRNKGSPAPTRQANKERKEEPEQQGTREERQRERGSEGATSQQRKGHPPPLLQRAGGRSPPQFFAPKNQQKVAWVDLKKFSEKFFGGMFRGKKNPLRYLNERGDDCLINLVNENRKNK